MRQRSTLRAGRPVPLSRIVEAYAKSYSSTSMEHDAENTAMLSNYVPGFGATETITKLGIGMRGGKRGRMISVTGPYGSGKSAMGVFIDCLMAPSKSAEWKTAFDILKSSDPRLAEKLRKTRVSMGIAGSGMIRCSVTAKREPITATILRALDTGARRRFGKYGKKSFDGADALKDMVAGLARGRVPDAGRVVEVVASICRISPVLLTIDEFGKNIEFFTDSRSREGDLFLLQQLAEMSGPDRKISLFMITLQHMAFEEYAVGASTAQRQEWAKVQGRFDDIPVANSPEQTRLLIKGTLRQARGGLRKAVEKWARGEAKSASDMGLGNDLDDRMLAACYPLHPLVIEVLPEMCSRYGQYERTLLSFIAGGGKHTVSRFIDESAWAEGSTAPVVRLDTLYDYFVSGSPLVHSASSNASRLMEIETIIRDSHGLSPEEVLTLKAIGVLNLVGRSGRLRASKSMVRYATGAKSNFTLDALVTKSIVTYRRYADEYRIWHGTDADLQAKLGAARRRIATEPLASLLGRALPLAPMTATKHVIETNTARVFERRFADPDGIAEMDPAPEYDGLVAYMTRMRPQDQRDRGVDRNSTSKPLIIVESKKIEGLKDAAVEAASIRDVLDGSPEISDDWVARRELEERLAGAKSVLKKKFTSTFGSGSMWQHAGNGRPVIGVSPNVFISRACTATYGLTPRIFNDMVNRDALSAQGSSALKRLMEAMIESHDKPRMGMDGWGPERSVYEAVLAETGIHRPDSKMGHVIRAPNRNDRTWYLWLAIMEMVKRSRRRLPVADIYESVTQPPLGARLGYMPVILIAILLANRGRIAVYEHGTYRPNLTPEIGERLVKNPGNFEIKYFANTKSHQAAVWAIASRLQIGPKSGRDASLLDVVSYLVATYSQLTPHIQNTKTLEKDAAAIRDVIAVAREPDVLLFEAIPKALGLGRLDSRKHSVDDIALLSDKIAKAVDDLRMSFGKMLSDLRDTLFDHTGILTRKQLSRAAAGMAGDVLDRQMGVFLTSVSNDLLEDDDDWIKYVALTITGVPPDNWTDDQLMLFTNNLEDISNRFGRLASIHFAKVANNFRKPSYRITVTHADGTESNNIVAVDTKRSAQIQKIASEALKSARSKGLTSKDVVQFAAELLNANNRST